MRFAYSVKQKVKIAGLLFCIMACTLLIRFLEDKSVKDMNESFVSMFNDRLIPATDLFSVAELAYRKQSKLEAVLYGRGQSFNAQALKWELNKLNSSIDSLINQYGSTFLVKQEKMQLNELKKSLAASIEVEDKILTIAARQGIPEARELYINEGMATSAKTLAKLSELMRIQRQIGEELIKDSAFMVSGNKLYSTFQVALAILIGALIVGIVFTSNVVRINNEKYNLN